MEPFNLVENPYSPMKYTYPILSLSKNDKAKNDKAKNDKAKNDKAKKDLSESKQNSNQKWQLEKTKKVDASSESAKKKIKVNEIDIDFDTVVTTDNKIIKKIIFEDTFNVEMNSEKYEQQIK